MPNVSGNKIKKMKKILVKIQNWMKNYKWIIHWFIFSTIAIVLIVISLFSEKTEWIKDMMQTLATISGIYLTLIIFLQSKEESDKHFREHIDYLQKLNKNQIDVLTENTQKQIEALQDSTSEQISSFEQQINLVTNKLSDNSILLAEILGRELEKAIELYDKTLKSETIKYNNLFGFKIGRTKEDRAKQINRQFEKLNQIQNGFNYLTGKYKELKNYLGNNNKLIS